MTPQRLPASGVVADWVGVDVESLRLDYTRCLVPGCERGPGSGSTKPTRRLPLCAHHEGIAWQSFQRTLGRPERMQALHDIAAAQDAADADEQRQVRLAKRKPQAPGRIYFLRQNGLIKVGWASDLPARLKAYGPDVEVLAHPEGTRADEALWHNQLTPFRARGREWYHDTAGMRDIIAKVVARNGKPYIQAEWTQPTEVIRLRR